MLMNKREKELYDKKKWKHTNPTDTLIKALKGIDFDKNGVILSIGANDYETEKELSERFTNNELIIATDVRGYDSNHIVNDHLFVLKDKIDAEAFTIDDYSKYFNNKNYKYKHGKPYIIYDRLSALWYSLYKGKTHITKKILDNYISLLDDNGYLITDFYENSDFINYIHDNINLFNKKYQNSTYELFKYYIKNIDSFIDKKYENDKNKLNHLMVISKINIMKLPTEIVKVNTAGNPKIDNLLNHAHHTLIFAFAFLYLLVFPFLFLLVIYIYNSVNLFIKLLISFLIYLIFSKLIICYVLGYMKRRIRNDD